MLKDFQLQHLKQSHLILLQKHIELGQDHLQSLLSQEGVEELCSLDLLNPKAEKEVEASPTELAGTFTKSFHGILTATLGAWLGLNGFMGYFLTSKTLYQTVMLISVILGIVIGIWNFRFNKREIEKRVEKRELQDIQLYILDFLNHKRAKELKEKSDEINHMLKTLQMNEANHLENINVEEFKNPKVSLKWLRQLELVIAERESHEDPEIALLFQDEICAMKEKIKKTLNIEDQEKKNKENIHPILEPLIHAPLPTIKKKKSWVRTNWTSLLMSSIPLLYGTFGSISSYLNNTHKLTQQVQWKEMHAFLTDPYMRQVQLVVAIVITIYFTFSFLNTNRKKFYRDQEIDKTQDLIIKKQGILTDLNDKLLKVKEVLISIQKIASISKLWKKISALKNVSVKI